jgi:hypothetical protein
VFERALDTNHGLTVLLHEGTGLHLHIESA